ncbi:uncharacterized protein LOC115097460 [Rhinatrema bivittatum]|uniref:uncharacterized protein LOC115097460 n=1 Tax=Rhinatrema bivittatum TaxID=194408 RepID=UPI00112D0A64|nr:uncharacterized protein LOC115097460 [Rhinatrema bivittatum]
MFYHWRYIIVCPIAAAFLLAFRLLNSMSPTYYALKKTSSISETREVDIDHFKDMIAHGTITPLQNNRIFIIAPYYDYRDEILIRIIAIIHHQDVKELYCWFYCSPRGTISIMTAEIQAHSDRWEFPFVTAHLLCLEPPNCESKYVSVHWSPEGDVDQLPIFEIRNREPAMFSTEFTVCISAMFGHYNNVLQFIQAVEMYKLLGAQKVMIYKNSCSQLMEEILQYYITEGTVEVIPWPINEYLNVSQRWHYSMDPKDIGYYGQVTALNDCVYRNMYTSKYVALNDIDEIILPLKHHDWKTLVHNLQKENLNAGVFYFENYVFYHHVFDFTFNISSWNTLPGINILQHIKREPVRPLGSGGRKMIVNPRKVNQTSVHYVTLNYGETVNVSSDTAILYHCRKPYQHNVAQESLVKDTSIWKYSSYLIETIEKVLQKIENTD